MKLDGVSVLRSTCSISTNLNAHRTKLPFFKLPLFIIVRNLHSSFDIEDALLAGLFYRRLDSLASEIGFGKVFGGSKDGILDVTELDDRCNLLEAFETL